MDTLALFTIRTAPHGSGSWLHVADDGDVALDELAEEIQAQSELGRIARDPVAIPMAAELEGQEEHYGETEIAASMQGLPLPYHALGNRCLLVSEAFLAALEHVGAQLRALPVTLVHPATSRQWAAWVVTFTVQTSLAQLRDHHEPVVIDRENPSVAYCSTAARDAIAAFGWPWLTFMRHDVRLG